MTQGVFTMAQQMQGLIRKTWSQQPPATYSGVFNGASQWLTLANPSTLAFGTNNFTIECWIYLNNVSATQILYDFRATSTNGVNPCVYVSSGLVYYYPAGTNQITGTTTLLANTWYHIALCRSSTSTNLYVNGVQQGSTYTDTNNYAVGTNRPIIGSNGYGNGSSAWLNGYISNLRMINGTALYTSAFTPPTAPLTAITNTVLLTLQNSTIFDASTNNYPITNVGNVTIDNKNPVNIPSIPPPYVEYIVVGGGGGAGACRPGGGGAGGFTQGFSPITLGASLTVTVGAGGAGHSGSTAPSSGCNSVFGNIIGYGGGAGGNICHNGQNGGSGGGGGNNLGNNSNPGQSIMNQGNPGGYTIAYGGNSGAGGGGGAGQAGGNSYVYNVGGAGGAGIGTVISGSLATYAGGGGTSSGNTGSGLYNGPGGAGGGGSGGTGTNGGSGTPNTGGGAGSAQTYTGGSGGSGIVILSYPDTYNAPIGLTGTVTPSTSGSGSIYFPNAGGSGPSTGASYIWYPSSTNYVIGTTGTYEFWIYPTAFTTNHRVLSQGGANSGVCAYYSASGQVNVGYTSAGGNATVSNYLSLNAWTHVAVVVNSGVVTVYFNGVSQTLTGTTTGFNFTTTSTLAVGGYTAIQGQYGMIGYLTNVRIVKGTAVYTNNFTPPTTPLTPISGTGLLLNGISPNQYLDSSPSALLPSAYSSSSAATTWSQLSPIPPGLGYKNRVYTWTGSGTVTF